MTYMINIHNKIMQHHIHVRVHATRRSARRRDKMKKEEIRGRDKRKRKHAVSETDDDDHDDEGDEDEEPPNMQQIQIQPDSLPEVEVIHRDDDDVVAPILKMSAEATRKLHQDFITACKAAEEVSSPSEAQNIRSYREFLTAAWAADEAAMGVVPAAQ